jgi:phosphocarrier protein
MEAKRDREETTSSETPSPIIRRLRVENQQGLHARPAASIVRLLRETRSSVTFTYKRQTVDANSILGILMLAAPRNAWITVSASGPDAIVALDKLEDAFRRRFGEQSGD